MDDLFQLAQLALVVGFGAGILLARTTVHATLTDSQASRAYLNNLAAPIVRAFGMISAVLVTYRPATPSSSKR